MTTAQRAKMTETIKSQVAKIMAKGATYEQSIDTVFESLNDEYPKALAAYINK